MTSETVPVQMELNGSDYHVDVGPASFLLDTLRDQLGALEVKEACDEGECGSCTVLIDGMAVDSCIFFTAQAHGRSLKTVASATQGGTLASLQRSFASAGAVQCGFCTPGFLLAAAALLEENARPTDAEVREGLAGNLCRCTGYNNVVAAVQAVVEDEDAA